MAEPSWESREMPILEAIVRLEGENLDPERLTQETGLEAQEVSLGLGALFDAKFIDGNDITSYGDPFRCFGAIRPLERARRATGQWPADNPYESLVALIEERLAMTDDAETQGRLRRLLDAVREVGTGVATGVLTALIKQQAGLA